MLKRIEAVLAALVAQDLAKRLYVGFSFHLSPVCVWLCVNDSVLNLIWILSRYKTLEIMSANGAKDIVN